MCVCVCVCVCGVVGKCTYTLVIELSTEALVPVYSTCTNE